MEAVLYTQLDLLTTEHQSGNGRSALLMGTSKLTMTEQRALLLPFPGQIYPARPEVELANFQSLQVATTACDLQYICYVKYSLNISLKVWESNEISILKEKGGNLASVLTCLYISPLLFAL